MNAKKSASFLDWALWYAEERGPVFPVKELAKKPPLTPNGLLDASRDPKQITAWWTEYPKANIAMRTGIEFFVFDKDKAGQEMYERLVLQYGSFGDTLQAITPNEGRHWFYLLPELAHIGTHAPIRKDDWGVGLDTRGMGGYVLVHPSIVRAADGKLRRYEWDGAKGENDLILPAPAWLLNFITEEALEQAKANARASMNGATRGSRNRFELPERIAHGTQHDTLVKYAGQLRARYLSEDEIFTLLWKANLERCEKPGPEADIRQYARSVAKYAPGPQHEPWPTVAPNGADDDVPSVLPWPDPIAEAGFHGVAGELVRAIEPHSEADPAALLVQTVTGYGNMAARGPHYLAEADRHHSNEFACVTGVTSKARKGTGWGRIFAVLRSIDPHWAEHCQVFGLGSGEALIDAVGEQDKRALVHEGEFARLLAVISREGSTISANLRTAWDTGSLDIRTRQQKVHVANAHIALIAHITRDELVRRLSDVEISNGFANRMLWVCSRRSKKLPHGGGSIEYGDILDRLRKATEFARRMGDTRLRFDDEAGRLWEQVYGNLSEGGLGMLGSVTSRAEAHVVRLSLNYALLDCSEWIRAAHLRAALALWNYSYASARFLWGASLGDPSADELLRILRAAGEGGLTRWEITNHFGRHKPSGELDRAIGVLAERGLIRFAKEDSGGRPTTRYWSV